MIYELLPTSQTGNITTIDQFGLNKLEANSRRYFLAPATIIGKGELPGVMRQEVLLRGSGGIDRAHPILVGVAAGSNPHLGSLSHVRTARRPTA